jgi:hypothetical protein
VNSSPRFFFFFADQLSTPKVSLRKDCSYSVTKKKKFKGLKKMAFLLTLLLLLSLMLARGCLASSQSCNESSGLRDMFDARFEPGCMRTCAEEFCRCTGNRPLDLADFVAPTFCTGMIPADQLDCMDVALCIRAYSTCVVLQAHNLSLVEAGDCTNWGANVRALTSEYTNATIVMEYADTTLFTICVESSCLLDRELESEDNSTVCEDGVIKGGTSKQSLWCPPALPQLVSSPFTPVPAYPIPTNGIGQAVIETALVHGVLRIAGKFSNFFAASSVGSAGYLNMLAAVEASLSHLAGFAVTVHNISEGSLVAHFSMTVPKASLAAVTSALEGAESRPQSGWLQPVKLQFAAFDPNAAAVLSPAVVIAFTSSTLPAATPVPMDSGQPGGSSDSPPCSQSCVIGIIIGASVFAIIVCGCLFQLCRKKTKKSAELEVTDQKDKTASYRGPAAASVVARGEDAAPQFSPRDELEVHGSQSHTAVAVARGGGQQQQRMPPAPLRPQVVQQYAPQLQRPASDGTFEAAAVSSTTKRPAAAIASPEAITPSQRQETDATVTPASPPRTEQPSVPSELPEERQTAEQHPTVDLHAV